MRSYRVSRLWNSLPPGIKNCLLQVNDSFRDFMKMGCILFVFSVFFHFSLFLNFIYKRQSPISSMRKGSNIRLHCRPTTLVKLRPIDRNEHTTGLSFSETSYKSYLWKKLYYLFLCLIFRHP